MLTFAVSAKPMEIINVYATEKNEENQRFINNPCD